MTQLPARRAESAAGTLTSTTVARHMSALLESALTIAATGWPVLPLHTPIDGACDCHRPDCSSPGKHPRTKNGLSDATTHADQIRTWWGMWPAANIGAVVPEGFVVVDVDVADLATVVRSDELPRTATSRTGRGRHLIYRTTTLIRPKVGVREHVDLRGPGSYIVVPPSLHLSGVRYEWVVPIEDGIADAPAWIADAARSPRPAGDRPDGSDDTIPEGQRNMTLASLAGAMRRPGMTVAEIVAALLAVNAGRCRPPLPDDAVRGIAASVGRYPPSRGRAASPPSVAEATDAGNPSADDRRPGSPAAEPPAMTLAETLDAAVAHLTRFVHFGAAAHAQAVALWVAHTHIPLERLEQSPILAVTSAVKQSGKTKLLDVLEFLVRDPWRITRPSESVLFRKIDRDQPTVLLDEVDTIFNDKSGATEGIRSVFNSGNRRGTKVPRNVAQGKTFALVEFDVFCPKVTAGIGGLPDTILDRAIVIGMQRRSRLEPLERLRERRSRELGTPLRDALSFHVSEIEDLTLPDEVLPPELDDRAQDGWEPLLAIADAAGGHWPSSARRAAVAIHRSRVAADDTHALRLLQDCRTVFESSAVDFLPTAELRAALIALDQSPWSDIRGREITPHYMGKLLRAFLIESARHRPFGVGNPIHGYFRAAFRDAWDRYVPPSLESGTSGTSGTDALATAGSAARFVPDVPDVPDVARAQTMQAPIARGHGLPVQTDGSAAALGTPGNGVAAGWHCSIGSGHVPGIRADGSTYCATCPPPFQLTMA
jgi:Protein of unknown function (DUF3631)/Bifunctional DNA primase/polymerase, N-terminal/Primase C terminal 1 (PriCT-1)